MLYHALYKSPIDTEPLSPIFDTVNGHSFHQPSNVQFITVVIVFKKMSSTGKYLYIFVPIYRSKFKLQMAMNLQ